jgi:hypothetical protein
VPAQSAFQALKQSIGPLIGFRWDPFLNRLDVSLHGGPAWILYSHLWPGEWLPQLYLLYLLWFVGLCVFLLWAAWTSRRELRVRALSAFALVWIAGGTVLAGAFSSAGPCFLDKIGLDNAQYAELFRLLDTTGTGVRSNQTVLWSLLAAGTPATFGGVSAFPSMHVAVAVLWALVGWRRHRLLGAVLIVYVALIQIGSVMLAWHYAIDGYAGTAIAVACWSVAGRFHLERPDKSGGTESVNRAQEKDDATPLPTPLESPTWSTFGRVGGRTG